MVSIIATNDKFKEWFHVYQKFVARNKEAADLHEEWYDIDGFRKYTLCLMLLRDYGENSSMINAASIKFMLLGFRTLLVNAAYDHIVMSDLKDSTVTYTAALPSPDYVPGLEELGQAPPLLVFVLEMVYPEFMPPEDDSDLEEDLEKDDDEDHEEDPVDYPIDRDDEEDLEEDPTIILLTKETMMMMMMLRRTRTRMRMRMRRRRRSTQLRPTLSHHLYIKPSPPLPVSPPLPISPPPLPASPTYPLGYKAAMIQLRAESPSASYSLSLPLPIVLPRTKASMAMMRVSAPSTCPRYKVDESSSAPTARPTRGFRADYGFVGTFDDEISASTTDKDCSIMSSIPRSRGTTYGGTDTDEDSTDTGDRDPEIAGTR
ncbi:hypothetical protein Tco_0317372 [Tanacetum coccineum]